ncbi:MAG: hypothetical protein C4522_21770 [Desulfobacteraceae bacterium]|nr:MAG: hypothetical protein C4522_21770 [Desulfobacteraceae bacterium]
MNIIITMAGKGRRFIDAGYTLPKYQIEVCGQTLFSWAMESLRNFIAGKCNFIFITRKNDNAGPFIQKECKKKEIILYQILELETETDGQATTALYAEKMIDDTDKPIAIYNIDTYVKSDFLHPDEIHGQGWIPCFPGQGDHWSFAKCDSNGRVVEVREKKRVSPHATIGFYWFESFQLYADTYRKFYSDYSHIEAGERYIAPMYNHLIKEGHEVFITEIPGQAVFGLGTPAEVEFFTTTFHDKILSS